jgi:VanZ family protein
MKRILRHHIFSILTILLITTLSLMPAQEFPQVDVQFADKWAHWFMYGFVTLVMGIEFIIFPHKNGNLTKRKRGTAFWQFLLISVFASLYGGLMELGQAYLTTSRHGDWLDVWANSFGALCAFALLLIFRLAFKR